MSGTSLIGKTALITGAGSGIGKACVEEFARAGARIIAVDRDEIALAKLASGQVATVVAELPDPEKKFSKKFNSRNPPLPSTQRNVHLYLMNLKRQKRILGQSNILPPYSTVRRLMAMLLTKP